MSPETIRERIYTPAEHERHYAAPNRELHADDARQFGWAAEIGTIQSYQHSGTRRHIHIDGPSGKFFDQRGNSIFKYAALEHAMGKGNHHAVGLAEFSVAPKIQQSRQSIGFGL